MVLFADRHGRSPVIYALPDILDKVHVEIGVFELRHQTYVRTANFRRLLSMLSAQFVEPRRQRSPCRCDSRQNPH